MKRSWRSWRGWKRRVLGGLEGCSSSEPVFYFLFFFGPFFSFFICTRILQMLKKAEGVLKQPLTMKKDRPPTPISHQPTLKSPPTHSPHPPGPGCLWLGFCFLFLHGVDSTLPPVTAKYPWPNRKNAVLMRCGGGGGGCCDGKKTIGFGDKFVALVVGVSLVVEPMI